MSEHGHSLIEAAEAHLVDGQKIALKRYPENPDSWERVTSDETGLKNEHGIRVLVRPQTLEGWAIEGCTAGPDGGPCEWCRSCPHLDAGRDYGDYVWFEVGENMHGHLVVKNVPIRSINAELYRECVCAVPEHLNRVVGFELLAFAREIGHGDYVLQYRAWEPDVRLDDKHFRSAEAVEEPIDGEAASGCVADYAIFRRV
mgnify:CR=1 FL=1